MIARLLLSTVAAALMAPLVYLTYTALTPNPYAPAAPPLAERNVMTKKTETATPVAPDATPPDPALVEQAQTEAAEVKADIEETKDEAAQARKDGDTDRAERLEARVDTLSTKLDGVTEKLDQLLGRPFHAAPEETPPTPEPATVPEQAGTQTGDEPAKPAAPAGRSMSSRWFGDRARA